MREWRDFEFLRAQRITPVIETLDSMIARIEDELIDEKHEINFRGR